MDENISIKEASELVSTSYREFAKARASILGFVINAVPSEKVSEISSKLQQLSCFYY